ncbi:hypothetical protein [Hyphococcus sp.]|uniref:hypothetical protein n=1 Tax=Hyphococcus sp. TaxID=2038636 RepID=UPI0035C72C03
MGLLLFVAMMAGAGIATFASSQMEKRSLIPKWTNEEYKRDLPEYKFWNRIHWFGVVLGGASIITMIILAFAGQDS